jgi:hypothetical protein
MQQDEITPHQDNPPTEQLTHNENSNLPGKDRPNAAATTGQEPDNTATPMDATPNPAATTGQETNNKDIDMDTS